MRRDHRLAQANASITAGDFGVSEHPEALTL